MSFKIVTIGCGDMASRGHGPSYRLYAQTHPDTMLAACVDVDGSKAAVFRNEFGFQTYYTDMNEALDREKPDAVCLVVPERLIAPLSIEILRQGYPLLMEKPPGLTREETLRMIEASDHSGVANQAAFNRRHMPIVQYAKKLLEEDLQEIELHHIRYDFCRIGRLDPDFSTTAVHAVDVVKYLAESDYKQIRFRYQEFRQAGPNVANIFMDCEFVSGVTAQINFCPLSGTVVEHATIHMLNHTLYLNMPFWTSKESPGRLLHLEMDEVKHDLEGGLIADSTEMFVTNGFYAENAAFFNDIRAGKTPKGDLRSVLQAVEIMECIRSRKTEYNT